jgi:hypothetical protein
MSEFNLEWLRQRAPFDAAARSRDLSRRFGAALAPAGDAPRRIVDLAAGSGANFMALAPFISGDQEWLLIDSDAALIAAQAGEIARWSRNAGWRCSDRAEHVLVEAGTGNWRARALELDLARSLERTDLAASDGVTSAAFLDLVSADWIDRLCALLARHRRPFLAALTVDGRREWQPALPGDTRIEAAFARHQRRDKGFGPALGARAASYLAHRLAREGYEVSIARSNWQIGAEHFEMLLRMAEASAAAAREAEPGAAALCTAWSAERRAQVRAGALTLSVGHLDLLALPA